MSTSSASPNESKRAGRPRTLREVAARSRNFADFGREFQDWLHTLRTLRSRPAIVAAIAETPEFLDAHFPKARSCFLATCVSTKTDRVCIPVDSLKRHSFAARLSGQAIRAWWAVEEKANARRFTKARGRDRRD
ncbi:MAG: hypothetical protein FWF96_02930 [Kiritimatiellaeota bacterium]|nr:hypothetical protein [Kiritimatiellota bacterium]